MPLIQAVTPQWKKRRTLKYIDANGKSHNTVQTAAPASGVASIKVAEYLGTTARTLTGITSATVPHQTGKYHLRQG